VLPTSVQCQSSRGGIDICVDRAVHTAFLGLGIADYFDHMQAVVTSWLKDGAVLLKVDGIGNPNGGKWHSWEDFEAATRLVAELRRISESVFINLSTGTWPSPFWLHHSDTVWRGGHDHYFEGEGTERERWLTYRDYVTHMNVVSKSPLFPLSSLMTHGIIFAQDAWNLTHEEGHGKKEDTGRGTSFRHEVRTAFGSGTMLQELYVTPQLLTDANWDELAAAARWGKSAADVMADTHWVGGDPRKLEVYGWAAWKDADDVQGRPQRALLTLRNPSGRPASIEIDPEVVFELPLHARRSLELRSPFIDQEKSLLELSPGVKKTIDLAPFEVLVFDSAAPAISEWSRWAQRLKEVQGPLVFTAIAGGVLFWLFRPGGAAREAPAVVIDAAELRRRRLAAFEGAAAASSSG